MDGVHPGSPQFFSARTAIRPRPMTDGVPARRPLARSHREEATSSTARGEAPGTANRFTRRARRVILVLSCP